MHSPRAVRARRGPGLCLVLALAGLTPGYASAQSDTAHAVTGLADYLAACTADHSRLWGRSLCGPLIVVQPRSRVAIATAEPPGGEFHREGALWYGSLPPGIPTANFSLTWSDRKWAMVLLPVPQDRYLRLQLLLHESFHRIQDSLGLTGSDALNAHLDQRDGRYWLRLELRAMAAALRARGAARDRAVRDALLFRRARQDEYPGADTLENQLERQEGLAEYTGARLALDYLGLPPDSAAAGLAAFEGRPTFVRSLGYGTGPGLGLLLDGYARGWRRRVATEGMAPQLAAALAFVPPPDPAAAAAAAAARYGGAELAAAEDARARERARMLAEYRTRLVDGPVLLLRQQRLARSFNPNALIAMGPEGTIYPTGGFGAAWGSLDVNEGGALVALDYSELRVAAPADTTGRVIEGPGWTLELAQGWRLTAGARKGDVEVVKE